MMLCRICRDGIGFRGRGWQDIVGHHHPLPCIGFRWDAGVGFGFGFGVGVGFGFGFGCRLRFVGMGTLRVGCASSITRSAASVERIHLSPHSGRQIARPVRDITHLALERRPFDIDGLLGDDLVDFERL